MAKEYELSDSWLKYLCAAKFILNRLLFYFYIFQAAHKTHGSVVSQS